MIARIALLLALAGASASAQADFSADVTNNLTDTTFHTKIFSTNGRLRFQGANKDGRVNSIMLVNLTNRTSIVLMPQQHQYVENKVPQIPGQGVTFFQAKDPEDACVEYQKVAESKDTKCRKVGHEIVGGRDTVKYEFAGGKTNPGFAWIDSKVHFPMKWANSVGKGELQNIREGPQPAELFEIPAGYTKHTTTTPPS